MQKCKGQALLILAAVALVAIHCWKTIQVHQPKSVLEGEGHHDLSITPSGKTDFLCGLLITRTPRMKPAKTMR